MADDTQDTGPEGISVGEAENALLGMFMTEPDETGELPKDDEGREQDHEEELVDDEPLDEDDGEDLGDEDDDDDYDEEESDGDEDDEAADEDHDEDASPTHKVKVNGEEVEVTLDEALSGYMRQQDYTQKSMANSEIKKSLREAEKELLGLEQEYEENLQLVGHVLTGGLGTDPDWEAVKRDNPDNYRAIRDAWMERTDQVKALKDQIANVRANQAKRIEAMKQEHLAEEKEKLRAAIPEWVDEDVAQEEAKKIVRTARFYGINPEDFESVTDHRLILVLRDAMLHRESLEAKSKGEEVRRRTRKTSTTLKPGVRKSKGKTSPTKKTRAARNRLKQTGTVRDAEAALLAIFDT